MHACRSTLEDPTVIERWPGVDFATWDTPAPVGATGLTAGVESRVAVLDDGRVEVVYWRGTLNDVKTAVFAAGDWSTPPAVVEGDADAVGAMDSSFTQLWADGDAAFVTGNASGAPSIVRYR